MNNKMKKIIFLLMSVVSLCLTSCLTSGLDDLPAYEDANITKFFFEYRWFDSKANKMRVTQMGVKATINAEAQTVVCDVTVPKASSTLPESERAKVSEKSLVGYCNISMAATIAPVSGSPKLGEVQDWSGGEKQYKVKAADGKTEKVWKVSIASFKK